jgi:hypothetical protein
MVLLALTVAAHGGMEPTSALRGDGAMEVVGSYGGMMETFCLEGDYAYIAESTSFVVVDLSTPTNPVEVGRCMLPASALQIQVTNGYAYVAASSKGLQVVDVSDPAAPFIAGGWEPENTMQNGYAVAVHGGYAYLGGNDWITVLDISDPADPRTNRFVSGDFVAKEMLVQGNSLFMAGYDSGLVVYSLVDASIPSYVTNVNPSGNGYFSGLALSGNTLCMTGGDDGLFVMDVSNPAAPVLQGSYKSGYNYEFIDVAMLDDFAYVAGEDALFAIDLSNPGEPTYHSHVPVSNRLAAVACAKGFVYTAWSAFNIYSPVHGDTPPQFQNAYKALADINVMELYNDTLLASARMSAGMVQLCVTNPAAPRTLGRFDDLGGGNAILAKHGVAAVAGGPDSNLRTFRIGESGPIELMGSLAVSGWANRLARSGSVLYVGGESGGVTAVDVSDPENPVMLDHYNCNYVNDLAYGAGYLYVADGSGKILILDARNPSNLQLAGDYDLTTTLVRYDNQMLITRGSDPGTFCLFNVANPTEPVLLRTQYTSADSINDMQVENGFAYILKQWSSSTGSGVLLYDISTPTSPILKASYDFPRGVGGQCIAVDGLYTYVGLGQGGLYVLKLLIPRITRVEPDFVPAGWSTPVMLYGDGFSDEAQVDIGAFPVTSTSVVSQTQVEAMIPAALAPGLYDVKITNPGGLNDKLPSGLRVVDATADGVYARSEDLFTTPAQPRASETNTLLLHLYRVGGASPKTNYPVVFYEGNPDFNGTVIGTGTVAVLPAEGMATCSGVSWTPAYANEADIYAIPDSSGVKIHRQIEVGPSTADATPPTVTSVRINGSSGNLNTANRNVNLEIEATDPGGEVKNMWVAEYVWNTAMGYWQTVQKTQWQPFQSSMDWTLTGTPGSRFIDVWVSDAHGNISEQAGAASINLVPTVLSIAQGQAHIFNYTINAGDNIHIDVVPTRGDTDLYVGTYSGGNLYSSRKAGTVTDSLDFSAPGTDWYSIIVYGYASASYSLSINGINTMGSTIQESVHRDTKPVPAFEFAGSGPPRQTGLPAAPVSVEPPVTSVVVRIENLTLTPDCFMPGDTVKLSCHLENQGEQTLSGTIYWTIHDSAGNPVQLLSQRFSGLRAGGGMDLMQYWTNDTLVPRNSEISAYVTCGSITSSVHALQDWTNAPFFFSYISASNLIPQIEWPSVTGRTYSLEMTTNIALPDDFTVVSNNITATPPVNQFSLPAQTGVGILRVQENTTVP